MKPTILCFVLMLCASCQHTNIADELSQAVNSGLNESAATFYVGDKRIDLEKGYVTFEGEKIPTQRQDHSFHFSYKRQNATLHLPRATDNIHVDKTSNKMFWHSARIPQKAPHLRFELYTLDGLIYQTPFGELNFGITPMDITVSVKPKKLIDRARLTLDFVPLEIISVKAFNVMFYSDTYGYGVYDYHDKILYFFLESCPTTIKGDSILNHEYESDLWEDD